MSPNSNMAVTDDDDVVLEPLEFDDDDLDWFIGWLEPHGSDFQSDHESDTSFAVLVPSYTPVCEEAKKFSM